MERRRKGWFRIGGLGPAAALVAVLLGSGAGPAASMPAVDRDRVVANFAEEILLGLSVSLGNGSRPGAVKPRVAIWPFDAETLPVAKSLAEDINARLLAALLEKGRERYDFVARRSLGTLIEDMRRTGVWDDAAGAPIAALLKSASNVDVLLEGRMELRFGNLILSYKALRMDGKILAQTHPARLRLTPEEASATVGTLTLDQAVARAARRLSEGAHDMTELRLGGIRYQSSGEQPPFGLYLQDRIALALEDAFFNVVTDRRLKVARAEMEPARFRGLDDTAVRPADLRRETFSAGPGVYVLTGTYWVFPDGIEVRVALRDGGSRETGWVGRLVRKSAGDIQILPGSRFAFLREDDGLGPIAFHLSTARGRDPVYRIGEKLDLLFQVDRDSWVHCYYRQVDRRWVRLFPNAHQGNARIRGGRVRTVPGDIHPFDLVLSGPVGAELVKCFATSREVAAELPRELDAKAAEPLGPEWDIRLLRAFERLRDADVTEASLAVTVVP